MGWWAKEPVLLSIVGSGAVWAAIFAVMAAFGHPLTSEQQTALLALLGVIGALVGRSQVSPTSGATATQTVDLSKVGKP